eukprot:TRINITY_DN5128_c0_g1_i1.p1 TRINITY_DN5128_c0_g1~~TRINITY_DN5128_c0_g1_i1.p1  ORF type:complete len:180 (+),score=44.74 TRINITY_DN5128_c0_g1_i1:59-598(+)
MDPALQLQEDIRDKLTSESDSKMILTPPEDTDEHVYCYELMRRFLVLINQLAVRLLSVCNDETCPMMMATKDWEFRCAAHPEPHDCTALSYTMHTLHQAEQALNSEKHFAIRSSIKPTAVQKIVAQQARRVYRIPAHAYYHHRDTFDEFNAQTKFMAHFDAYLRYYKLVAEQQLIVPLE